MKKRKKTTQQLFNELIERLIISVEDNEVVCPTCKGLRLIYKQKNDKEGYIKNCPDCYNGKLYVCEYCGKTNRTNYCNCEKSQQARDNEYNKELQKKELELFNKAEKINFKDYEGKFILEDGGYVKDSDDVYNWLYEKIKYDRLPDEELPKYLCGTQSEPVFNLDLNEIIQDKSEDGYEDMYNCLDTNDKDLDKAQEYIDKWYQKQGDSINIYYEDPSVVVLLDDVIKKIREDIEKKDNKLNAECVINPNYPTKGGKDIVDIVNEKYKEKYENEKNIF